jgi:hypothetical protein
MRLPANVEFVLMGCANPYKRLNRLSHTNPI